jgi:hypothetical protein
VEELNAFEMLIGLGAGLSIFFFGVYEMTLGMREAAADKLRAILERFTTNRVSAVATGALSTGVVGSSSIVTIMTVGLVSAGLLKFANSLGVVMGANIGTTLTSQIIAFGLTDFFGIVLVIGAVMRFIVKNDHRAINVARGRRRGHRKADRARPRDVQLLWRLGRAAVHHLHGEGHDAPHPRQVARPRAAAGSSDRPERTFQPAFGRSRSPVDNIIEVRRLRATRELCPRCRVLGSRSALAPSRHRVANAGAIALQVSSARILVNDEVPVMTPS